MPIIDTSNLSNMINILLTCKKIRAEGQPNLAANTRLILLDSDIIICDLPQASQRLFLDRIQEATFTTGLEFNTRHQFNFDLQRMPKLKTLHLMEPFFMIFTKDYSHEDVDELVAYASGAEDDLLLIKWYQTEQKIMDIQTEISSGLLFDVRELLRGKNKARYWLRDLLHNKSNRSFKS